MALCLSWAMMPSSNEQKSLDTFFERSTSANLACQQGPSELSSSSSSSSSSSCSSSSFAAAAIEFPPKARGNALQISSLPGNSHRQQDVQIERVLSQDNATVSEGAREEPAASICSRNDECNVSARQPKIPSVFQLLDGLPTVKMEDPKKLWKLNQCEEVPQAAANVRRPEPLPELPALDCGVPSSVAGNGDSCQPHRPLTSSRDGSLRDKAENAEKIEPMPTNLQGSIALDREEPTRQEINAPQADSRKVLRLNGTGGLGPPNFKNTTIPQPDGESAVGSSKRAKAGTRTMLVVLQYVQSDKAQQTLIGRKIDDIQLASNCTLQVPEQFPMRLQATAPSKPTHPFFLAKAPRGEHRPDESIPVSQRGIADPHAKPDNFIMSFSTPGKMRYQAHKRFDDLLPEVHDNLNSHLGSSFRLPGTFEASWPPKGMVNVGGLQPTESSGPMNHQSAMKPLKRKNKTVEIQPRDDVLRSFASKLFPESYGAYPDRAVKCSGPHPTRLLLSNKDLQARIRENLQISLGEEQGLGHRALASLFDRIEKSTSSFDKGECEGIPWTQKHAPTSTAEVLQPEREMRVLRTWLESQTVVAADNGSLKRKRPGEERRKQRKKRQRISDELGDFIVESDDEMASMRDFSDEETATGSKLNALPRSVVQDNIDEHDTGKARRSANAVLISGPHGCGKTAAALAAAKELYFEVFEIGPGTRRSGKDILDKVGDMTLNHQVSNSDANPENEKTIEEDTLPEKRCENQSTLASFITMAPNQKTLTKMKKDPSSLTSPRKLKQPARQKQSLILLEEVDVLFEQDKQFWETVIELALQSKRPIIMTCSDESLVPLHELSLHAILRFRAPPEAIAVKYLLLLAAVEGHLLQYEAAANLYKFRRFDLRASIFDLDFWCQMAVGDGKAGMEWYLERWPPGADVNEHGHTLRIISENTLRPSMGVLGQTPADHEDLSTPPESLVSEAWAEWGFEPANISGKALHGLISKETRGTNTSSTSLGCFNTLSNFERLSNQISAVDVFSSVDLPSTPKTSEKLDTTQPPMPDSRKADFMQGLRLVQVDLMTDYPQFDTHIAIYVHLRVKQEVYKMYDTYMLIGNDAAFSHELREQLLEDILNHVNTSQVVRGNLSPRATLSMAFQTLREDINAVPSISSFDRNVSVVAEDLAPYIRSIAAYDLRLERTREIQSAIEGVSNWGKVPRRTRASRSAMDGSQRSTTRRERWFSKHMNLELALKTGGFEGTRLISDKVAERSNDSRADGVNLKYWQREDNLQL